ncbi:hypothetical protein [Streptomyces sp. NRRL WC-3742]|uniref:hypothetical protein n=1 Tax=Streptomyces sp. NRRL WC-3742 TaxID=1463934 RepID=UPI002D218FDA|nr:hypothetical protein [Streptomyces sp. NRRL WC-3742]
MHGIRLDPRPLEEHRRFWREREIPDEQIDRMIAFEERWGGLALPPAPAYDGGPRLFGADSPEGTADDGWWFEAGDQRSAVPFLFMIGPNDEFGIHGPQWAPLHAGVEGWVESVALAHHVALFARTITRVHGAELDALDLDGFEPVPEVQGLADTWWRGRDSYVAVYRGESQAFAGSRAFGSPAPQGLVYQGLPEWACRPSSAG